MSDPIDEYKRVVREWIDSDSKLSLIECLDQHPELKAELDRARDAVLKMAGESGTVRRKRTPRLPLDTPPPS